MLEQKYPTWIGRVHGRNYPASPGLQMFASLVGSLQLLGFAFIFFGEQIFSMMGVTTPAWHAKIIENRMMAVVSLFMMNSIAHNMLATGAFEIEYNGHLLFSKLEAKRMPNFPEIVSGLKRAGFNA
jgi:selT/selW/selH-like putative selenoprotein